MDHKHPLHLLKVGPTTVQRERERPRSRHPFVPTARKLLNELSELSTRDVQWIDNKWTHSTMKVNQSYVFLLQGPAPGHLARYCPDLLGYGSTSFTWLLQSLFTFFFTSFEPAFLFVLHSLFLDLICILVFIYAPL